MLTWLKMLTVGRSIKQMDKLEPIFAAEIREAQRKFGSIDPDKISKSLVDKAQIACCGFARLDPSEVLKD